MMKLIYVVSPDYLNAIEYESKKYSFALQGYRDIDTAIESIHLSNSRDVYGFAYVAENIYSFKSLFKLIRAIDLTITKPTKLVLVVQDSEDIEKFKSLYRGSKVHVEYITDFEVISDILINNSVFGTILKSRLTPYIEQEDIPHIVYDNENSLYYNDIINSKTLEALSPVKKLKTLGETLKYDTIMGRFIDKNNMFYKIRLAYISAHFGKYTDLTEYAKGDLCLMIYSIDRKIKEVSQIC